LPLLSIQVFVAIVPIPFAYMAAPVKHGHGSKGEAGRVVALNRIVVPGARGSEAARSR